MLGVVKNMHGLCVIAGFACIVQAHRVRAYWHIWTVTETRHVLRSDRPGNETSVKMAASRNGWESFQILIGSDATVKGVTVHPGDLKGLDGAILPAEDAWLYRQHQMVLPRGTKRNVNFKPDWFPDPLIRFKHPLTRKPPGKARFAAVPFDLLAEESDAGITLGKPLAVKEA